MMKSKTELWKNLYLEAHSLAYGSLPVSDCSHMSVVDFQTAIEEITGRLVMDHRYNEYADEYSYYSKFD